VTNTPTKPSVVILGTGFGAYRFLKGIDTRAFQVFVVSPRNYFLFTPLLASSAVGTIEFRSIVEPIRHAKENFRYYQARGMEVKTDERKLVCETGAANERFELSYDKLVIAVGAETNTFGIPGVSEHALFLKDIADARAVRSRIIECFDLANGPDKSEEDKRRQLSFVIIGGGPTGIEFAAELHDLITEDLSKLYPDLMSFVTISVLEASPKILSSFDDALSGYTARTFRKQNIAVRTESLVTRLEAGTVHLKDGSVIHAGLILWSAGIAPASLIERLPFPKERGKVVTDEYLAVTGSEDIYAIGDCAIVAGRAYPATGQLAQSQGKYLAASFNNRARGRAVKAFTFLNLGMLAYVGSGRALVDVPHLKGRGFFAWLLWRSIYVTKLVSLRNKISVLFDWLRTFFFGREYSRF